jgi:Ni,Fe-hydrogenase III component G
MTGSWIDVESQNIRHEMGQLIDSGKLKVLSTISGYQEGDKVFIVYHLINHDGVVNVRTSVPMTDLNIDSISTILPGATLYEREIQDILGVKFEGIIDNRRLILPEQWPNGVYPLRKDYKVSREEQQNG